MNVYNYYGHDEAKVVTQPEPGQFAERPMTIAERAARDPAKDIAENIYKHANYAGVCYIHLWALIAMACQKAIDDHEISKVSR